MSDNNTPIGPVDPYANSAGSPTPVDPTLKTVEVVPVAATGETVAERHLGWELGAARQQLLWTQIGSVALSVLTLGYLTYLTTSMNRNLEPKAAAEIAQGIVQQQVEDRARDLSNDLKQRIPKLVASFPDYAKEQLPQYRQRLEQQIDTDLNRYLNEHSGELDKMVDEALDENKEQIGAMLKDAKDPTVANQLGEDLQNKMLQKMNEVSVGGESLQAKLDSSLANLNELEKRMAKLAANQNLTPSEKKARRAIALLASQIDSKDPSSLMKSVSFDRIVPAPSTEASDDTANEAPAISRPTHSAPTNTRTLKSMPSQSHLMPRRQVSSAVPYAMPSPASM